LSLHDFSNENYNDNLGDISPIIVEVEEQIDETCLNQLEEETSVTGSLSLLDRGKDINKVNGNYLATNYSILSNTPLCLATSSNVSLSATSSVLILGQFTFHIDSDASQVNIYATLVRNTNPFIPGIIGSSGAINLANNENLGTTICSRGDFIGTTTHLKLDSNYNDIYSYTIPLSVIDTPLQSNTYYYAIIAETSNNVVAICETVMISVLQVTP